MHPALRAWLPAEHGVWGLLAAATLVGLPLGGTLAGLPILGAALVAVLLRARCRNGLAVPAVVVGGSIATALVVLAWQATDDRRWVGWLAAAAVPALATLLIRGRSLWASAAAVAAFACLAGAVAAAGGAPSGCGAIAAVVLAVHLGLMIPLVRAQVRPDPRWVRISVELHVVALCLAVGAWAGDAAPSGIPLVFGLGLARAALLVDNRTPMSSSPARVGAREMAWMPIMAAVLVLSLRGGWS